MKAELLWQKLTLAFILIALLTIAGAYVLLNYVIDSHFQGYLNQREKQVYERIGQSLATAYAESGGWDNQLTASLPHFALTNRIGIEVHDAKRRLIAKAPFTGAKSDKEILRQLGIEEANVVKSKSVEVPIIVRYHKVGYITVAPLDIPGEFTEEDRFRLSLNRSLVFGGLMATLAALVLGYLLSKRMTRSLTSIAAAAKNLEEGDFSQRVEIESDDEIGQLGEAFNHLARTLQEQEQMRKNLTTDVAHELRTPLAIVRSQMEAYIDGVLEPDPKNLSSLHEEILRLGRLVDDLGKLAKAEGGRIELKLRPVDLGELVEKVSAGLAPLCEDKKIKMNMHIARGIICNIDEDKIRQVILNLMVNAVKFTPRDGSITVIVGRDNKKCSIISVTDTGPGIDEDSMTHIFERFYRVDKSRNRATGGSGIGLTIAAELVRMHGGKIDVSSDPGRGSTFTVVLPDGKGKSKIHNSRIFSS